MKKKFYLIIFVVLLQLHLNAQNSKNAQPLNCDAPATQIDDKIAQARMDVFRILKKEILLSSGVSSVDLISVEAAQWKTILGEVKDEVTAKHKDYDGIRIYFAITDKDQPEPNKLTVVLVPTIGAGILDETGKEISYDDITRVYVLKGGVFSKIDITQPGTEYVIRWVKTYQKAASRIEAELLKLNIHINETHSLWYSKAMVFLQEDPSKAPDFLTYLQRCPTVTHTEINFGCWSLEDSTDPEYTKYLFQNDLIFKIGNQAIAGKYFTLGAIELKKYLKEKLSGDYGDTGLPCPPNKCP